MPDEIEFKLSIAPEQASDLWRTLASRFPDLKPVTRPLFSAYYDTPDARLASKGMALRLRREDGRWIQTIKSGGSASGGLHRRFEHDTEVAAQLPSFPAMIEAGIGDVVADRELRESLRVLFTTEFDRSAVLVHPLSGTAIEVALDRGVIASGERREAICEIELELKAGDTDALFDLARMIAEELPVRLDNRSKAERGYALAAGIRPQPVKAGQSPLKPGMAVDEALVALAFHCLAHLQANERGVIEGRDPEYRHQARVALRRLRSLFRTFAPIIPAAPFAEFIDRMKLLAATIGEARNLDVFISETLAMAGNADHPGMLALKRRTQLVRRKTRQAASQAISEKSQALLMLRFTAALMNLARTSAPGQRQAASIPLEDFAHEALSRQHAKVKKRGRNIDTLSFADLHRLRIAIKRLRYSIEFFAPLELKQAHDALSSLSALQELLGHLNDNATTWKLLDSLAVNNTAAEFQQAVGFVRGWTARDGELCRSQLGEAWKRFEKPGRRWR